MGRKRGAKGPTGGLQASVAQKATCVQIKQDPVPDVKPASKTKARVSIFDVPNERLEEILQHALELLDDPLLRQRKGRLQLALVCRRFNLLSKQLDQHFAILDLTSDDHSRELRRVLERQKASRVAVTDLVVKPISWHARSTSPTDYYYSYRASPEPRFDSKQLAYVLSLFPALSKITIVTQVALQTYWHRPGKWDLNDGPMLVCTRGPFQVQVASISRAGREEYYSGDCGEELAKALTTICKTTSWLKSLVNLATSSARLWSDSVTVSASMDNRDKTELHMKVFRRRALEGYIQGYSGGALKLFRSLHMDCTVVFRSDEYAAALSADTELEVLRIREAYIPDIKAFDKSLAPFIKLRHLQLERVGYAAPFEGYEALDADVELLLAVVDCLPPSTRSLTLPDVEMLADEEEMVAEACAGRAIELIWQE